ncbi:unnamed protein product [Rangifer tarandus platyrhynchus]|uniref:Uncharacterized protein n=2 Tax=Rangifer tarandus platyrhynchus TaxID=3082113 RepID=A0ABN8Y5N7_RANTA|nr:unnamed protein product [Rangifer tarandus platyrhynchus]CAI9695006.1 unnamed protein product [Rangifer tarandus platyrhynchus]
MGLSSGSEFLHRPPPPEASPGPRNLPPESHTTATYTQPYRSQSSKRCPSSRSLPPPRCSATSSPYPAPHSGPPYAPPPQPHPTTHPRTWTGIDACAAGQSFRASPPPPPPVPGSGAGSYTRRRRPKPVRAGVTTRPQSDAEATTSPQSHPPHPYPSGPQCRGGRGRASEVSTQNYISQSPTRFRTTFPRGACGVPP